MGSNEATARLTDLTEEELFVELGARVEAQRRFSEASKGLTLDADVRWFGSDALAKIGKAFWKEFEKAAYGIICGDDEDTRKKISTALEIGVDAAVVALAGVLAACMPGLAAAAIAAVIAALVIKLFFKPTLAAMCKVWSEDLPGD